jgi:transposase
MIPIETWAEIRRLFYVEHQTVNAIRNALGIHSDTVKRAIGAERFVNHTILRKNEDIERFNPVIMDILERVPRVRATRLLELLKERGFSGSVHQLRRYLRKSRPQRPSRVFSKLSFVVGEQAQCDWASCGKISVGNSTRLLSLFVMVLSYSRRIYARFTFDQTFESFAREHIRAFEDFCGVPRVILYDNLKAAVIERFGKAIHFSPQLIEISGYYHFRIEAAAVANPQTKGRVERTIGYLKTSFLPGREFKDINAANQQLFVWLRDIANVRLWPQERSRKVDEVFSEEKLKLLPLPEHHLEIWITKSVRAVRWPFIRFETNDYEIPCEYLGKSLTLQVSDLVVRILDVH